MSYVILDLEWNGSYSKKFHKYVNEIIEFGAIKTDDNFNVIDSFTRLVTPQIGKKLCKQVLELTKITNEDLKLNGVPFMDVIFDFTQFVEDSVVMTWSTSDILALIENYSYYVYKNKLPFLSYYCNIQKYCQHCLGLDNTQNQLGLSACADILNINYEEENQHRATDDAILSLKCIKCFSEKHNIKNYFEDAFDNEFYKRITYKTHYLSDINNANIKKSELVFLCPECNSKLQQENSWKYRNKYFSSELYCDKCDKTFIGRVSFKKKYDCVVSKKKIAEKKVKDEESST